MIGDNLFPSSEVAMTNHIGAIAVSAALSLLLIGCQKSDVPKPVTSDAGPASAPAGKSVALPPNQMPPSDASIPPASPTASATGTSGDAQPRSQGTPSTLSKHEESAAMPQTGQVNNYSPAVIGPEKAAKESAGEKK
jgi:hypothetical protein